MKRQIKRVLTKAGIYEYLKYSRLFRIYESLFKPGAKDPFEKEVKYYHSFLSPCHLVFDIGANDGHKTEAFLTLAGKVVSCEPDDKNYKTLVTRFRNKKNVVPLKVAIGAEEGESEMFVHYEGSAFNTLQPKFAAVTSHDELNRWNEKISFSKAKKVNVTTLDHLIKVYGLPYYIKIDVEGYESEVISGLSQPVPYLSVECLFPEFRPELNSIIDRLVNFQKPVSFNISVHEELLWKDFVDQDSLQNFLNDFKEPHFELIVKTVTQDDAQ